ncbi:MAG: bifunctional folylpolyglutamate synthase/dihydrofolate synthase [Flavobacteriales bacterium AspAUS03]
MNYSESLQWLLDHLPMYQKQGKGAYRTGLDRIESLCIHLGQPQHSFRSIHIGGTNGKGSTVHMLASILQEVGYRVGLFTSPHLKDFRERIRCNGSPIEESFIVTFVAQHKNFLEQGGFSFFEMNTALAFDYFKEKGVDIVVVEVGMGGRLDSTNVILPMVSVITHIGWDHMEFLGDTLAQIAREKAGIIKSSRPVVIGPSIADTQSVFLEVAREKKAPIYFVEGKQEFFYEMPLQGDCQALNQSTVLKTVEVLRSLDVHISEEALMTGFQNILTNTHLQGRWQYLQEMPKIICDIAHNQDSIRWVVRQLSHESYENLHLVLGFVQGRDVLQLLSYFPIDAFYYFCQPDLPRRFSIEILEEITGRFYEKSAYFLTVTQAFLAAKKQAGKKDVIFVGGSTFVVSEVL